MDFNSFTKVGKAFGSGTTSFPTNYSFTDPSPFPGVSYYRLTQTDYDGTTTFHKPASVERPFFNRVKVYPNPSGGGEVYIKAPGWPADSDIPVEIYDSYGRLIFSAAIENNVQPVKILFSKRLVEGIYLIKAGYYFQGKFAVE